MRFSLEDRKKQGRFFRSQEAASSERENLTLEREFLIQDRVGAKALLIKMAGKYRKLKTIFADGGYTGKLIAWCFAMFYWTIQVVKRNELP